MSETCIVCLGDLGGSVPELPLADVKPEQEGHDAELKVEGASNAGTLTPQHKAASRSEFIAHLLPCGHNLHDECLRPWVERANSCPICRQTFNQVDLLASIGGPLIRSYAVDDKTQVADIDPSMVLEDYEEPEYQPCPRCGQDDNEDVLLLCDGCNVPYHTYCVDLDSVPRGLWFCDDCAMNQAIEESMNTTRTLNHHSSDRRTRGQVRRIRNRSQENSADWGRVWRSILERTRFDLDFPWANGSSGDQSRQRHRARQSREFQEWERRLHVAEQQGGPNRFRDTASILLDPAPAARPRPEPEEPESIEEIMAWNALEKARDIEADPTLKPRKRKSPTASPSDADGNPRKRRRRAATVSPASPVLLAPPSQPVRRLKRPQTRRVHDLAEPPPDAGAQGSSSRRQSTGRQSEAGTNGNAPSFLQSLLKEVESSTTSDETTGQARPDAMSYGLDHPSPQYSSPGASPTASHHPSPRLLSATPPPGPIPLTSSIEPIYPLPDFSPLQLPSVELSLPQRRRRKSQSGSCPGHRTREWIRSAQGSSPPRSEEHSPTRAGMSLSAKENVQKLVKDALKEPYRTKQLNKDQYTEINRNISRMLYDRVGEKGDVDGEESDDWKRLASEEVAKAVRNLQAANA